MRCAFPPCFDMVGSFISETRREPMPAYFVVELDITNRDGMADYRAAVPATLAQYGGNILARRSGTGRGEGGPGTNRSGALDFDDAAAIQRGYGLPPDPQQ